MSLTPCRFFAQGNCRFGNNCRFYHGQPAAMGPAPTGYFGNRTLAPSTFQHQPHQQQQQQAAVNLTTKSNQSNLDIIMETVKKDMYEWQNSGIWPYSCYGPIGQKPNVPGFEDFSQEEYRYNYMLHGNTLPPQIPQQFQQMCQLRLSYQHPGQENRIILERIATATNNPTSPIPATQQAASIFGGGGGTQQGSIFGGSANTAPQQQTISASSIFGGGATQAGGGGIFGNQQQQTAGSIFGGGSAFTGGQGQHTAAGPSLFSQPAASVANTNVFQSQQVQQQQSIFSAPPPAFGQTSTVPGNNAGGLFEQSILGQNQLAQQRQQTAIAPAGLQPLAPGIGAGLFQQQQQAQGGGSGLFQMPQQQQQQLQQQQQQGQFGGGSIFGAGQPPQYAAPPPTSTPSIFGGSAGGNNPLMQGGGGGAMGQLVPTATAVALVGAQQKGVYTPESELTPEELEAFKADQFTLENLPTRPPPQSLCL